MPAKKGGREREGEAAIDQLQWQQQIRRTTKRKREALRTRDSYVGKKGRSEGHLMCGNRIYPDAAVDVIYFMDLFLSSSLTHSLALSSAFCPSFSLASSVSLSLSLPVSPASFSPAPDRQTGSQTEHPSNHGRDGESDAGGQRGILMPITGCHSESGVAGSG